jgi:NAD(P)-dependent dehydrogenase (short-subunit alcohol dehydrogenase family)
MRPLSQQTVVVTGASSGIGRCSAHEIARRGANVVLAARSESSLREVAGEVERAGGQALPVPTDVAEPESVRRLADRAVEHFGRIDTWVNDAALSEYAKVQDTTVEEFDRILRVNVLGVVAGSKAALAVMRRQREGGTILSWFGVPLQSADCASKGAVKNFTEALRRELKIDGSPVRICLVMPGSTNTPFFVHARSKMGVRPKPLPPTYEPETVARAIAFACESPRDQITVGAAGKLFEMMERMSSTTLDAFLTTGGMGVRTQLTNEPWDGRDNLDGPLPEKNAPRGEWEPAIPASPYTAMVEQRSVLTAALGALAVGGLMLLAREMARRPARA